MTTIQVKAHARKKPSKPDDPFAPQIQKRMEQMRAAKRVNEYRNEMGYKAGPNALTGIIDALRKLAVEWRSGR